MEPPPVNADSAGASIPKMGKRTGGFRIAGAAIGLSRLFLGLWAIRLCRQRGAIVNDPTLIGLCGEIQLALGCHQEVEIREVPDLTSPATAGWRRPVILLPDDWRSWDAADRRAVLAHELAHIRRWDYAAGLVARLARGGLILSPAGSLVGPADDLAARAGGRRDRSEPRRRNGLLPALAVAPGARRKMLVRRAGRRGRSSRHAGR